MQAEGRRFDPDWLHQDTAGRKAREKRKRTREKKSKDIEVRREALIDVSGLAFKAAWQKPNGRKAKGDPCHGQGDVL